MSITINELSIAVPGNVVKSNQVTGRNETVLRVTQNQAQSIYNSLGPVLAFFAEQQATETPTLKPLASVKVAEATPES